MKKLLALTAVIAACSVMPAFANDADMKAMCDHKFDMMDSNKDGKISMDEHEAASKKMFMDADTNHDGMVSKDEHTAMMKKEMMMAKDKKMMDDTKTMDKSNMMDKE